MSELDWKPLANAGKHDGAWCEECNDMCGPAGGPCRCCLEADLAVQKAATKMLGERVFDAENALAHVRDIVGSVLNKNVASPDKVAR